MSARKLMELKKRVDEAKTGRDRAAGSIQTLKARLKEEFGCGDVKSAEKKLVEMEGEIQKMDKEISEGVAQLEGNYDWN